MYCVYRKGRCMCCALLNKVLLGVLCFWALHVFPFISWVVKLEHGSSSVTLVADVHSMDTCFNTCCRLHKKLIIDTLERRQDKRIKLFFEDIADYKGNNPGVIQYAKDQAGQSDCVVHVCDGLSRQFSEVGYDAHSIEYRFCREAGIVPSLSWINLGLSLDYYESSYPVLTHDIWQEFDDVAQQVQSYNDSQNLNRWYAKEVERYNSSSKILHDLQTFDGTIKGFLKSYIAQDKYYNFLQRCVYFDAHLLDAIILHNVFEVIRNNNSCMVFVGAGHAYRINKLIQKYLNIHSAVYRGKPYPIKYPPSLLDVNMAAEKKNDCNRTSEPAPGQAHPLPAQEIINALC